MTKKITDEVTISVDWNSLTSIEISERAKVDLENKGYTLINSFGGLFHSVLIYALIEEEN